MKKYLAEFIGTAILVVFGCGSAVAANTMFSAMGMLPVAFTTLLIAVAFGLALTVVVYAFGDVSGAHVNPAVSLGMLLTKRMSVQDFIGYVIAQILGAVGGALLLSFFFGSKTSLGANGYGEASTFGASIPVALVMEMIMTFVFVSVVLKVTAKAENRGIVGLVAGGALTLVYIFGVPFTGASVNPARSLGPALIQAFEGTESLTQVWVFIVAPLVGAALAAGLYMFFISGDDEDEDSEEDGIDIPLEALTEEEKEEIKAIAEAEGVEVDVDGDTDGDVDGEIEIEVVAEGETEIEADVEAVETGETDEDPKAAAEAF